MIYPENNLLNVSISAICQTYINEICACSEDGTISSIIFERERHNAESVRAVCMTTCMKCMQMRIISTLRTEKQNTGRFIIFSVIKNIYNKKTKGPTLMELFTATGKRCLFFSFIFFSFLFSTRDVRCIHHGWHGTHRYDIQVLATHASTCWLLLLLLSRLGCAVA